MAFLNEGAAAHNARKPANPAGQAAELSAAPMALVDRGPTGFEIDWLNPALAELAKSNCLSNAALVERMLTAAQKPGQRLRLDDAEWRVGVRRAGERRGEVERLFVEAFLVVAGDPIDTCRASLDAVDPTTGLATRAWFDAELPHRFDRRGNRPFALLFIDADDFKSVNDTLGHVAGDRYLRIIADRIADSVRDGDTVARFGGDEFVVLLDSIATREAAAVTVERIGHAVAQPIDGEGDNDGRSFGVSVGVALSNEGHATAEAMLTAADRDMYSRKGAS
ncbi:Phytochrome-like protein cph2 [Pseudobythopirellula maris]|uniref:Phytochrome-like protein cph2 n=1 Tax=Pseudobythopirellula maris TaxID=2527991 RepID=A0A5C5ZT98_9BACT|nr:GGDEF domain-containing protein [Pseudobythopirellula maris]TWT90248.1 Phytochrome-like protein cph2 [Pseudobythopirellula maris]